MKDKKMPLIYEPKGPAREYAAKALNVYKGCTHRCQYCYNSVNRYIDKESYFSIANPKKDIVLKLIKECRKIDAESCPEILISFIGDFYQPGHDKHLNRDIIKTLIAFDLPFTILTKGGLNAISDFDILSKYDKFRYGVSLSFIDENKRKVFEPGAAPVLLRIESLKIAKELKIKTWMSLEPVIDPAEAIKVIEQTHQYIDEYKIGKINHFPEYDLLNKPLWKAWRDHKLIQTLDKHGANYYIKNSLSCL
jgi:DNA repair photolyase